MNRLVELLKGKVFFLATDEAGQPRVRPFGAVADIDGKFYICTGNTKNVFRQMMENPKVEMSAMLDEVRYLRVTGTAIRDGRLSSKQEFLRQNPFLSEMYKAEDGVFEVLSVEGCAEVFTLGSEDAERIEF